MERIIRTTGIALGMVLLLLLAVACGSSYETLNAPPASGPAGEGGQQSQPTIVSQPQATTVPQPQPTTGRTVANAPTTGQTVANAPAIDPQSQSTAVPMEEGFNSIGGSATVNDEPYDVTFFKHYGVNPFIDTEDDHLSTFAVDVDTASYSVARRFVQDGNLPEPRLRTRRRVRELLQPGVRAAGGGSICHSHGGFAVALRHVRTTG